MTLSLWLKGIDAERFREVCDAELRTYLEDILTCELENHGVLSKIGKRFVLGKEGIWTPKKEADQKFHFVYIKNSSAYPEGLMLTPYSNTDVECHLKTRTIDQTTGVHREELMGSDRDDFAKRVFTTYYHSLIKKHSEKDNHLVLYSINHPA